SRKAIRATQLSVTQLRISIAISAYIDASSSFLMPTRLPSMMKTLGNPDVTPELKQTVIDGVVREAGGRSVEQLAQSENEVIIGLLKLRANASPAEKRPARAKVTA